jgi:hypothetical protein
MKQFLIYLAERMLNILHLTKNDKLVVSDTVFPTMDEVAHCVERKLVSEKDHVIYKLILDYYEQLEFVAPI